MLTLSHMNIRTYFIPVSIGRLRWYIYLRIDNRLAVNGTLFTLRN